MVFLYVEDSYHDGSILDPWWTSVGQLHVSQHTDFT